MTDEQLEFLSLHLEKLAAKHSASPPCKERDKIIARTYFSCANTIWEDICAFPRKKCVELLISVLKNGLKIDAPLPPEELVEILYRTALVHHLVGENQASLTYIERALSIQAEMCAAHPLAKTGIRFLQSRSGTLTQFGHL